MAARSGSVPLADGGFLHSHPQNSAWRAPKSWPRIRPGRSELLGLRVRAGQIHVELVPVTEELRRAGRKLAGEVGPLSPRGRYWATDDYLVSQKLVAALWSRMAADPAFLTQPVPPFSECIPALASAVHREHERRREQARHWRPQLDLPAALHDVAVMGARRSGQPPQDWLSSFVSRSLRELSDRDEGMLDDACGEVLPLQPRLWRA